MKYKGFVVLNKDGSFGFNDNTEFFKERKVIEERVQEIEFNADEKLKIVPATLIIED